MELGNLHVPTELLEVIRSRLNQVHLSLRKLLDQVQSQNRRTGSSKMPTYGQFQNQFQVILTQMHTIMTNLDSHDELLGNLNAYPLPNFPTSMHEGLITTLLRKKPLPEVDEWIEGAIRKSQEKKLSLRKEDDFAQWCSVVVEELRDEFQFYGFGKITEGQGVPSAQERGSVKKEERENVTGGQAGLHPNQVLSFTCKGFF